MADEDVCVKFFISRKFTSENQFPEKSVFWTTHKHEYSVKTRYPYNASY